MGPDTPGTYGLSFKAPKLAPSPAAAGSARRQRFGDVSRSYGNRPWQRGAAPAPNSTVEAIGVEKDTARGRYRVYGKSLTLQMLLYYNIVYSLCFTVVSWGAYFHKVKLYKVAWKHQMWYAVVMMLWTAFEVVRLICGYVGNLTSSVQHLIGFVLFSVMNFALVGVFYAVDKGLPRNPHDRATAIVHFLFIVPEMITCVLEAKRQIRYHTVRYYLSLGNAPEA
eukprot:TRINITY_DN29038_c0_g1_i1.p1 TRINITY_DN29038_c0_g1~~TRINITY_DN29038_c0_g1_i1.p1  ORF type:complete len:223 (+),score=64.00 TRINITY_DN29038_c0_g1_i1:124-792(+)